MSFKNVAIKSIIWFVVIILLLVSVLICIFFHKDSLDDDLQVLLQDEWIDTGIKDNNACYYLLGFNASSNEDAFEKGLELSEFYSNLDAIVDYWDVKEEQKKLVPLTNNFPINNEIQI